MLEISFNGKLQDLSKNVYPNYVTLKICGDAINYSRI
jgi:hypothetical protein